MFTHDTLSTLALEILKNKCDLTISTNEEILKCYFEIWTELKTANSKLPKPKLKVSSLDKK